ncbi:hypothetical protein Leryth_010273 [Lithospermum erythrorhizon]|nr:hypothetical protein Leryth_010273 [Lithospermum erythrorhizon]
MHSFWLHSKVKPSADLVELKGAILYAIIAVLKLDPVKARAKPYKKLPEEANFDNFTRSGIIFFINKFVSLSEEPKRSSTISWNALPSRDPLWLVFDPPGIAFLKTQCSDILSPPCSNQCLEVLVSRHSTLMKILVQEMVPTDFPVKSFAFPALASKQNKIQLSSVHAVFVLPYCRSTIQLPKITPPTPFFQMLLPQ